MTYADRIKKSVFRIPDIKMTCNDTQYMASDVPVALTSEFGLLNDFLLELNT